MSKDKENLEPTVEVVGLAYRSRFWRFFLIFLVVNVLAGSAYFFFVKERGGDGESGTAKSSFIDSLGNAAKETFVDSFGGVKESVVEVVDVRPMHPSERGVVEEAADAAAESEEKDDDPIDSSDESDNDSNSGGGDSSAAGDNDGGTPVVLCQFDTDQAPLHGGVVINEVAWMGGTGSPNDEWIELRNVSGDTIDINNWQLTDVGGQIQAVLQGSIAAGSFYLLERTDDSSAPGVAADMIYTGALSNSDEGLRFFDDSCGLVDEVFAEPDWPAGDGQGRRTMQREGDLSWSTFGGSSSSGVFGTPGFENGEALVTEAEEEPEESEETSNEAQPPAEEENGQEEPEPEQVEGQVADFSALQITDIIFDVEGADGGNERVFISNNGGADVDISSGSFQYLGSDGDFSKIKKKNFESGNTVPSGGTFVVGMDCHADTPCTGVDMTWSQSLNNTSGAVFIVLNKEGILDGSDADIVNRFDYSAE